MFERLKGAWKCEGGYRDLVRIACPMFLMSASTVIMQFCDRKFLGNSGTNEMAAALPSGHLIMSLGSLFFSALSFAGPITAQYIGARQKDKSVDVLWTGMRAGALFALAQVLLLPVAGWALLRLSLKGALLSMALSYYMVQVPGVAVQCLAAPFFSFYTGRGKTVVVSLAEIPAAALNVLLDWVMIFGHWGSPKMGIVGAGVATSISLVFSAAVIVVIGLVEPKQFEFATRQWRRFDKEIFKKLFRFGLPSGFQLFSNHIKFSAILLLVGTLGPLALASSTIPLTMTTASFMPMVAVADANMILCGQFFGKHQPMVAVKSTRRTLLLSFCYTAVMLAFYAFASHPILYWFAPENPDSAIPFKTVAHYAWIILIVMGSWQVMDSVRWSFSSFLRAAGDTKALMWINLFTAWIICVPGFWVLTQYTHLPVYIVWSYFLVFSFAESFIIYRRYRTGAWAKIKLI